MRVQLHGDQLPVAKVHDVTVESANTGGTATASIDNGSFDPDGDAITLTQNPAGLFVGRYQRAALGGGHERRDRAGKRQRDRGQPGLQLVGNVALGKP